MTLHVTLYFLTFHQTSTLPCFMYDTSCTALHSICHHLILHHLHLYTFHQRGIIPPFLRHTNILDNGRSPQELQCVQLQLVRARYISALNIKRIWGCRCKHRNCCNPILAPHPCHKPTRRQDGVSAYIAPLKFAPPHCSGGTIGGGRSAVADIWRVDCQHASQPLGRSFADVCHLPIYKRKHACFMACCGAQVGQVRQERVPEVPGTPGWVRYCQARARRGR